MRQVLLRAIALLRRPWVLGVGLVVVGGGCALSALPLFNLPGYELATALAIATGLLGGIVGGAAGTQERRLLQGRDPRPRNALREDSPLVAAYYAIGSAFAVNVLFLVPPLVVAVLHAVTSTRCDPLAHLGFYPVLALPSALLASALGVFCALATRRVWTGTLLYLGFVLASAVVSAWPVVMGPQVYAYNHFGGYLPGPLYDEALSLTPPVLWYRLQTLLLAGTGWMLVALGLNMREGRLTRPHFRPGLGLLLGAFVLAVVTMEGKASSFGFRMTPEALRDRLGGFRETAHFVVVFPRGKPKEEVNRLLRDLEFRYAQLAGFFGGEPGGKIHVYLYRSPEEKQALVGAERTQFAKPWRLEVHLNDAPLPHPTMKHELSHVMASIAGAGPFKVTMRGLLPQMGIIEGMAVAADNPVDELTLHEWAAGMRKQKLAPDVRDVLGPRGFYGNAPARAYTVVGSFLRYLADTYGTQKLLALYAHGDFQTVYGRTLDSLASEWEKFLDQLPLNPNAVAQAFLRFRQASLFARPCAREVASAQERAAESLASDPQESLELYQRCAEIQPDEPAFQLGQAAALTRMNKLPAALEVLRALQAKVRDQPALATEAALAEADLTYQLGKRDQTAHALESVLATRTSAAIERTARVKLMALKSPSAPAVFEYFRPGADDVKLLRLREALDGDQRNPVLAYLLGRRLSQVAPKLSLGYLSTALAEDIPDSIRREALRLSIESAYLAGDCAQVRDQVGKLPDLGLAFKRRATEWVERCAFEEKTFNGPLVPEQPFR